MLLEKDNILKFNQYMKSDKMPDIIYTDIESLIKKIDGCAHNQKIKMKQKLEDLLIVDIQCQLYELLII